MATSTLMKFSLLTIIVVLSSYISYTEAVSACSLPSNPNVAAILEAYNCTITNCAAALAKCTGPNCDKGNDLIVFLQTDFYSGFKNFVETETKLLTLDLNMIASILKLISEGFSELMKIFELTTITIVEAISRGLEFIKKVVLTNDILNALGAGNLIKDMIQKFGHHIIKIMIACVKAIS